MNAKTLYTGLALIGAIVPLAHLWEFLKTQGPAPQAFIGQLFASPVSSFFGWDVILSAVVLLILMQREGVAQRVPHLWAPMTGTLLVGVSFGLPLYLALRESSFPETTGRSGK